MDLRFQAYIYLWVLEEERKNRIIQKLDIAEAVNFGYIGSKSSKGANEYRQWRKKYERELWGDSRPLIWESVKKKTQQIN